MKKVLYYAMPVLIAVILFLALPVEYVYYTVATIPAPACPPANAQPGAVYNCPLVPANKTKSTVHKALFPLIYAIHRENTAATDSNGKLEFGSITHFSVFILGVVALGAGVGSAYYTDRKGRRKAEQILKRLKS